MILKAGATSQSIYIEVLDSTSTTGGRKTGLAYNTSSLTAYYVRAGGSATSITLATLAAANSAYSSGGFKEVDATNMPGVYRLDIPDAAIAASVPSVVVTVKGATGMVQVSKEIVLTAMDLQTALPSNFATLVIDGSGRVDVSKISGTSQTARDIGASVLLSAGTGTGQLDFTSGVVKANLAQILGTALTETAGQIAAAFKQFFDVGTPTGTMKAITAVTTVTNLTNAPTSGDLTATMKTSVTTAATAATPTAAAVTGNVGGSVGSLATQAKADVNAEVVDALTVDTYAEPGAVVGATASIKDMLNWVKTLARNKLTQTSSTQTLFKDDGSTPLASAVTSDDGTTATRGEFS